MSVPQVKKGKWSKERERTKLGRWRKKRSDAGQSRAKKHNRLKYVLALIAVVVIMAIVLYLMFPDLFSSIIPFINVFGFNTFSFLLK